MALIKCIECGKKISDTIETCIHCGCPLEINNETEIDNSSAYSFKEERSPMYMLIYLGIIIALILCVVGVSLIAKNL